ncbi:MAG: histidine kinase [Burkholderiaceae bacterium]|nr:ATP-binding protein [Aquabacterium sp.]NUP84139.1 histidine kinase [Burkholderiaceae bacterium]
MNSASVQPSDVGARATTGLRTESLSDSRWVDQALLPRRSALSRWVGWRLRVLVVLGLLGSLCLFAMVRAVAAWPSIKADWRLTPALRIELVAAADPSLAQHIGRGLVAVEGAGGARQSADILLARRSLRWMVDDAERARQATAQDRLARTLAAGQLHLHFDDGSRVEVKPAPRGFAGLGALFWLLCALALVVYLIGAVIALAAPNVANLLYAVVALAQSGNLALIATESMTGMGMAPGFVHTDLALRTLLDMITAAAVVHASLTHPTRLPHARVWLSATWIVALLFALQTTAVGLPYQWSATQALLIAMGVAFAAALTWSYRVDPHPYAIVLRRLGWMANGTLVLLTLAIAATTRDHHLHFMVTTIGSTVWYVFFASLLLLVPFMARSRHVMREFAVLAGISAVATSLDVLLVSAFALDPLASLSLSIAISLALYAAARHWMQTQLGGGPVSAEHMFEGLFRVAREIESDPRKTTDQLTRMLREWYEPLETQTVVRTASRARVAPDGSTMVVPVPALATETDDAEATAAILLRYARRGRRLFTVDDARLIDRVLEQLRRAVAFDRAVEQGRGEERLRIAQDLHDDIGARLLTLMYKAENAELEEYIRHTLQDLKTLTRGLAASTHRLSDSAAEWKADITQRLQATQCELSWSFTADRDIPLSVIQWSGITRILRELVNNIIAHAHASQVQIQCAYERGRLTLHIVDDGIGRNPAAWSHGLGLGGVRKRVKLLGGDVAWREREGHGIACDVRLPLLGPRR